MTEPDAVDPTSPPAEGPARDSAEHPAGGLAVEVVPAALDGERVDVGLARLFGISRTQAAHLTTERLVRVAGRVVGKSDTLVAGTDLVADLRPARDPHPEARLVAATAPGLDVVHLDPDVVVVDKPVGVAAHPSPGWTGPTVLGHLAATGIGVAAVGPAERQGIVHRLDVGTSGLMVLARSPHAYTTLKAAFHDRTVDKTYHALVQGHPDPSSGTVDAPIGRDPHHDWRWAVTADGRPSVTHYATLEAFRHASLLEIGLETGRTHQIRVHMSTLHHPCVGDTAYGADPTLAARLGLRRQWLHAVRLGFAHPADGRWVVFDSPYPVDLAHALDVVAEP